MFTVPSATGLRSAEEVRIEVAERLARLGDLPLGPQQMMRLGLLRDKLQDNQCVLAFCGHFSAGKSTLINRLAGSQILPASPIPTSANQVLIRHGAPGATVRLRNQGELRLDPSDLDRLAGLCADGDAVDSVEISHPLAHVPAGVWLMDSPGLDSTDEAHRLVTESALYLADAVFYVMDYNHVQSEVNLRFTRAIVDWGKPLYLIINQVDKHVELELPFARFRESVTNAFAGWGVRPDGVFFTSLREPDHPLNQWDGLLESLRSLGDRRDQILVSGVWNSAIHLMEEEERIREQALGAEKDRLLLAAEAGGPDPDLRRALVGVELEGLAGKPQEALQNINRDAGGILANAPLFPFTTKELAQRYVEARQPHFRVGFLFSEGKTRAEVERRLGALHAELAEKVAAHIEWHLRSLFLRVAEEQAGRNDAYEREVRALAVPLEAQLLTDLIQPRQLSEREYHLQYIKIVTEAIQARYRRAIKPLADRAAELVRARAEREAAPLRAEADRLLLASEAIRQLGEMAEAQRSRTVVWSGILGENPCADLQRGADGDGEAESGNEGQPTATSGLANAEITPAPVAGSAAAPALQGEQVRCDAARRLHEAAHLLAPLPGMARTAADLEQRGRRLRESRFTVALFGAFSAGKSSFANALMGMQLLPVSPNPTTAVITRIVPPGPERPHGYVHVLWKQPDQIRAEVECALDALGLPATGDIAADLAAGATRRGADVPSSAKAHAAFLQAAARGYGAVRDSLGREEAAGLAQFSSLVADEQRACFVAEVTVHVDCPVTRHGITLVDTPGADSINARHTDVAFEYIKNADAILFVTYYNHAFSRADQEFLVQLGRVKDAFALDKMFFVINAADLATDEAELELVAGHVRKNLQACGIRQARIFPVSSQTALWSRLHQSGVLPPALAGKLRQRLGASAGSPDGVDGGLQADLGLHASGMAQFETDFYRFVVTDLSQMAVDGAMTELRRSAETLTHWLAAARQDEGTRTRRLAEVQAAQTRALAAVAALDAGPEAQEVEHEIEQLLFYVRRRVLVERFRATFAQAFNSSALRQDAPDIKRSLRQALSEVIQFVSYDLAQEMRATSLRVENAVNRQGERAANRAAAAVQAHLLQWSGLSYTPVHPKVPTFSDGRDYLSVGPVLKLLGLYRNAEQFFAGGGRNQLCDELVRELEEPVAAYLAAARATLAGWYGDAFSRAVAHLQADLATGVSDHVRGLTAALAGGSEVGNLEAVLAALRDRVRDG